MPSATMRSTSSSALSPSSATRPTSRSRRTAQRSRFAAAAPGKGEGAKPRPTIAGLSSAEPNARSEGEAAHAIARRRLALASRHSGSADTRPSARAKRGQTDRSYRTRRRRSDRPPCTASCGSGTRAAGKGGSPRRSPWSHRAAPRQSRLSEAVQGLEERRRAQAASPSGRRRRSGWRRCRWHRRPPGSCRRTRPPRPIARSPAGGSRTCAGSRHEAQAAFAEPRFGKTKRSISLAKQRALTSACTASSASSHGHPAAAGGNVRHGGRAA